MIKRFLFILGFLLILFGCTESMTNNMPFSGIVSPAFLAFLIVLALLFLVIRNRAGLTVSPRRLLKKNLTSEIGRAKRFNHKTGLLIVDVKNAVPRGVHYFLPGRTVDVESFQNKLREYDHVIKISYRRYKVILSQITADDNPESIKERILKIAEENNWGDIRIGVSVYPRDGDTADSIIKAAQENLETSNNTAL